MDNRVREAVKNSKHSESWLQTALAKIEARIIAGDTDVNDAPQCITSVIASVAGIDGAAIGIVQDESLTCIASDGMAPLRGSILGSTFGLYAECLSSGRMVWCQDATTDPRVAFQENVPSGVHSAMVLPLWVGGRVNGILAVFAGRAGHLGAGHITVLATAAAIASTLEINGPVISNRTDTLTQAAIKPNSSHTSGTQFTTSQGFLAELLADQEAPVPKHSRMRMPLFVLAGLALVLLCGALFGGVARIRDLVYPLHQNSSHIPQVSAVNIEIGDALPADSADSTGGKKPKMTGGHLSQQVNPVYPADALRDGIRGDVNATLVVNNAGVVENVLISQGNSVLANAVISALAHWRYSAFYVDNRVVSVSIPVRVTFRQE